jgi:hypothetical protein
MPELLVSAAGSPYTAVVPTAPTSTPAVGLYEGLHGLSFAVTGLLLADDDGATVGDLHSGRSSPVSEAFSIGTASVAVLLVGF